VAIASLNLESKHQYLLVQYQIHTRICLRLCKLIYLDLLRLLFLVSYETICLFIGLVLRL